MELIISILAIIISGVSVVVSVMIYCIGVQREKKQATLDAINVLQEQALDNINQYTNAEIAEICEKWHVIVNDRENSLLGSEDKKNYIKKYRVLSGYLARIEHFALGVNTGIYDAKISERAATTYLLMLYKGKLRPIIEEKNSVNPGTEYYAEFQTLIKKIEKLEKKKQ